MDSVRFFPAPLLHLSIGIELHIKLKTVQFSFDLQLMIIVITHGEEKICFKISAFYA